MKPYFLNKKYVLLFQLTEQPWVRDFRSKMAASSALFRSSSMELYLMKNSIQFLRVMNRFYAKSAGKVASTLMQKSPVKLSQNDDVKNNTLIKEQGIS